jgi:hypothetical protein
MDKEGGKTRRGEGVGPPAAFIAFAQAPADKLEQ